MTVPMKTVTEFLTRHNVFWQWNGHKHLALLTSGKISDFFANCSPIFTEPRFQDRIGGFMKELIEGTQEGPDFLRKDNKWIVGSAMGAIGLAQSLARAINCKAAFTEPVDANGQKKMELKRFELDPAPVVFLVEDVLTTGGTTLATIEGITTQHPDAIFFPYVLSVINRSGKRDGFVVDWIDADKEAQEQAFKFLGIVEVEPKVWDKVEDLPPHMRRCVPMRPKENWDKFCSDMSL